MLRIFMSIFLGPAEKGGLQQGDKVSYKIINYILLTIMYIVYKQTSQFIHIWDLYINLLCCIFFNFFYSLYRQLFIFETVFDWSFDNDPQAVPHFLNLVWNPLIPSSHSVDFFEINIINSMLSLFTSFFLLSRFTTSLCQIFDMRTFSFFWGFRSNFVEIME